MESVANLGNADMPERRDYWKAFLDFALKSGYGGYAPISVSSLKVLHGHLYHPDPTNVQHSGPLWLLRTRINFIRRSIDWFRYEYCNNGALPTDILLSETGHDWNITNAGRPDVWTGGWPSFRKGLNWWNTYLSWLTRRAPTECQLTSGKVVYACPHSAAQPPYVSDMAEVYKYGGTVEPDPQYRYYLNFDNFQIETFFNSPVLSPISTVVSEGRYQNRFSVLQSTVWSGRSWLIAPFGVCHATWAQIANDPNDTAFGSGWYASSSAGVQGSVSLSIQAGWNTVYFAAMKSPNQVFAANTAFTFHWSAGGLSRSHGYMSMDEFDPPFAWTYTHPVTGQQSAEYMRSSMIFPVLCYSSQARTVTLQVQRNYAGGSLWLGRPIVLPVGCTWFSNQ